MKDYLEKQSLFGPLIGEPPNPDLQLVVVIPCYDEPDLIRSLNSLWHCQPTVGAVELLVVINDSEQDELAVRTRNQDTYRTVLEWAVQYQRPGFKCFPLYRSGLPTKYAGVGLARKIGLDEGCRRLKQARQGEGVLVFFDADSKCDPNYLVALESYFADHPSIQIVGIYFEHPLEGSAFKRAVYEAVIQYELHLRYVVQVQRWAGFPHAVHTIGSSMAVRSKAYQQQGGMNRRQAGEDFYFMHKFTPLGVHGQLTTTRIIPSPRPSHRVPFGTGRAVVNHLEGSGRQFTYAPSTFKDLRTVLPHVGAWWTTDPSWTGMPAVIRTFLEKEDFVSRLAEIRRQSTAEPIFINRFFRWFNAFRVIKYAHWAREHYYPDVPVEKAAQWLMKQAGFSKMPSTAKDLLLAYRTWERELEVEDCGM